LAAPSYEKAHNNETDRIVNKGKIAPGQQHQGNKIKATTQKKSVAT
jgi:hypothetical protein